MPPADERILVSMEDSSDSVRWDELASYLESLSEEDLRVFSFGAGVEFPAGSESVRDVLRGMDFGTSPSDMLSLAGQRAGASGDPERAVTFGRAALELADTRDETVFARVCLAQTYFRGRKDPQNLAAFEEHCEAAVELGHAGTFCYERLLVLYEYRGDLSRAIALCRRAVEVLTSAGDETSARRYRERLPKLERKRAERHTD